MDTTAILTTGLPRAKADLAEPGYCLIEGALDAGRVAQPRLRIAELALKS